MRSSTEEEDEVISHKAQQLTEETFQILQQKELPKMDETTKTATIQ